jgi:hypothetical protein
MTTTPAFADFTFKLLVVEELMYRRKVLAPAFDLREHLRPSGVADLHTYAARKKLAFKIFPQARKYFEELEIPAELLPGVDRLVFDGGIRVFRECAPVWDGEDDLFAVRSLADLDLLPNLRHITGGRALAHRVPDALDVLDARGITY